MKKGVTMKSVYIFGPITGIENDNADNFNRIDDMLMAEGYIVHNPVKLGAYLRLQMELMKKPDPTWTDYMAYLAPFLINSDMCYGLKGWENSKGAYIEFVNAKMYGKELRFE